MPRPRKPQPAAGCRLPLILPAWTEYAARLAALTRRPTPEAAAEECARYQCAALTDCRSCRAALPPPVTAALDRQRPQRPTTTARARLPVAPSAGR